MPKVSICVPAYENAAGIERLLESVKKQSYTDYEVVITDDSVSDEVEKTARAAQIKNLSYYRNEERRSAAANWNRAIRLAKGDYIKMMHHDDWFTFPDSLQQLVELLDAEPDALLAFCGSRQVQIGGQEADAAQADGRQQEVQITDGRQFDRCISKEQRELIARDWRNLYLGNYIGAPSATLVRKSDLLYEERLTWLVDMEYYMRILAAAPRFAASCQPLVSIGISGAQLTESCRENGELNLFEYGFLFREFSLKEEPAYRKKLIEIALEYHQPYERLKEYEIPRGEYRRLSAQKKKNDAVFLAGVAVRRAKGLFAGKDSCT